MITDERGNKLPQPRINKKDKSRNERMLAATKSAQDNEHGIRNDHCPQCGFRVRSVGHFEGKHHNQ
jgi:hypothetical protein